MSDFNNLNMMLMQEIFGALILCLIPFAFWKKLPRGVVIAWAAFIFYQVIKVFWLLFHNTDSYAPKLLYVILTNQAQALVMLCCYFPILFALHGRIKSWKFWAMLALILDFILILCGWEGLCGGKSIDPYFLALFTPYILSAILLLTKKDAWVVKIGTVTPLIVLLSWIVIGKSITALSVMLVSGFIFLAYRFKWPKYWAVLLLGAAASATAFLVTPNVTFQPRISLWTTHLTWWQGHMNVIAGDGLGVYQWVAPFVSVHGIHYCALHNDFLQVMFDCGILGLFGLILVVTSLLWAMRNHMIYYSMACGFVMAMLTYYPLHLFAGQAFIILLISDHVNFHQGGKWEIK